ncbi:hypothetical protein HHK36_025052 [Tetracentron sinense]|uniref:RNase H type-1 domain-containing protein n=1 Tax=Tetracentron sinense TaxID=13715 RepID=A0A834YP66_TETSI|nr:hypothetical protein HHK36_025052 [Tetracentron sinense]
MGSPFLGVAANRSAGSVVGMELLAIKRGIQIAQDLGFSRIRVSSDSSWDIACVQHMCTCHWEANCTLSEITAITSSFLEFEFVNNYVNTVPYHGDGAWIGVYNPAVSNGQFSNAVMWIDNGYGNNCNSIQVGWTACHFHLHLH